MRFTQTNVALASKLSSTAAASRLDRAASKIKYDTAAAPSAISQLPAVPTITSGSERDPSSILGPSQSSSTSEYITRHVSEGIYLRTILMMMNSMSYKIREQIPRMLHSSLVKGAGGFTLLRDMMFGLRPGFNSGRRPYFKETNVSLTRESQEHAAPGNTSLMPGPRSSID